MNPELTPGERAEMRDSIVAGSRRLKSSAQRRLQVIGATVAFVVVGGIAGGAVATAAILGGGDATTTPTPTPSSTTEVTPTPTPTPTPTLTTPPSTPGVVAFGGLCENALTDAEAAAATGKPMRPLATAWDPAPDQRLGGLACAWSTAEEYMGGEVRVTAYPRDIAEAAGATSRESCVEEEYFTVCAFSTVSDDVRVSVEVRRVRVLDDGASVDVEGVRVATQEVLALAAGRAAGFPAPSRATTSEDWWSVDGCDAMVAELEATGVVAPGSDVHEGRDEAGSDLASFIPLRMGTTNWCALAPGPSFQLWPGAADRFAGIPAAGDAAAPEVPGAVDAILAPSLDAYEGHYPVLVVSDGVNLLGIPVYGFDGVEQADIDLAAALLEVMARR